MIVIPTENNLVVTTATFDFASLGEPKGPPLTPIQKSKTGRFDPNAFETPDSLFPLPAGVTFHIRITIPPIGTAGRWPWQQIFFRVAPRLDWKGPQVPAVFDWTSPGWKEEQVSWPPGEKTTVVYRTDWLQVGPYSDAHYFCVEGGSVGNGGTGNYTDDTSFIASWQSYEKGELFKAGFMIAPRNRRIGAGIALEQCDKYVEVAVSNIADT